MTALDDLLRASGLPRKESASGTSAGVKKIHLHAGQLYATAEPAEIITILGSCVAVCLFEARRGIGGINHFMLPTDSPTVNPRYAGHACDLLLGQLLALGARRANLSAKIFGGASVLHIGPNTGAELGTRNIEAARAKLALEQIPIVGEDVGGVRGRKLVFLTADGTALIRQV